MIGVDKGNRAESEKLLDCLQEWERRDLTGNKKSRKEMSNKEMSDEINRIIDKYPEYAEYKSIKRDWTKVPEYFRRHVDLYQYESIEAAIEAVIQETTSTNSMKVIDQLVLLVRLWKAGDLNPSRG